MNEPEEDPPKRFVLAEQWWPGLLFWIVVVVIFAAINAKSCGGEVKLAWNPNPTTDQVQGYRLYRLGTPNLMLVATSATTATVTAFPGEEVAVAAFNAAGESDLSTPVTIPEPPPTTPELDREGWTVAGFSSEELVRENGAAGNAIDGTGMVTYWNSNWDQRAPHFISIKLPKSAMVSGLRYTPWQGKPIDDAYIQAWQLQSSMDGVEWEDWASGTWANTRDRKTETLPLREVRYFRLWGGERYASASDLILLGSYVPDAPKTITLTLQQSSDLSDWSDVSDVPPMIRPMDTPRKSFRLKIEQ